jgi:hypothetical protein
MPMFRGNKLPPSSGLDSEDGTTMSLISYTSNIKFGKNINSFSYSISRGKENILFDPHTVALYAVVTE